MCHSNVSLSNYKILICPKNHKTWAAQKTGAKSIFFNLLNRCLASKRQTENWNFIIFILEIRKYKARPVARHFSLSMFSLFSARPSLWCNWKSMSKSIFNNSTNFPFRNFQFTRKKTHEIQKELKCGSFAGFRTSGE